MTGKRNKGLSADKLLTRLSPDAATTQSETSSPIKYADITALPPDPIQSDTRFVGRPTKYDPEFNQRALKYAAEGKTLRGIAAKLGVCRDTLYEWSSVHKEFSYTLLRCRDLFADFMEYKNVTTVVESHQGIKLNNGGWNKMMGNYEEYQTKNNNNNLDLSGLPDDFEPPKSP